MPHRAWLLARWEAAGRPLLPTFAPYTTHVFKVDLLYYLVIDRGFISGARVSNKADMAYLYYLPFTMVFVSGDRLHRRTAPLFLTPEQSYVEAIEFKAGLREIDEHYDHVPEEIKAARRPPVRRLPAAERRQRRYQALGQAHAPSLARDRSGSRGRA
jgi:hypothetical protein